MKQQSNIPINKFVQNFPERRAREWVANHEMFAVQCCIVYLVSVFVLKNWMKTRKPFNLSQPMNVWNAILAVTSLILTLGMTPEFFTTVFNEGINASVCNGRPFFSGFNGFLVWLFHLSKVFELVDTFFIILRKKPLIFLHWYHHALTLYFCWYEYPAANAFTRWGIYLNSMVHSVMYSYYYLRSIGIRVPRWVSRSITTIQIIQFAIAFWSLGHVTIIAYAFNYPCEIDLDVLLFSWLIDVSYLGLFINFYLQTYVWKKHAVNKDE